MQNTPAQNVPPPPAPVQQKKMSAVLTAWLTLIVVIYALMIILYAIDVGFIKNLDLPGWYLPALIVVNLISIAFVIALLRWKRWGFWGFLIFTAILIITSIIVGNYYNVLTGVLALVVLFALLYTGGENKPWPQLE